ATDATLNAGVNPQGKATTYKFLYDTTSHAGDPTAYAFETTPPQSAGADTTTHDESASIRVTDGVTYYYRVQGDWASPAITNYGAEMSFVAGDPPTVTDAPATDVTGTDATLHGTVNPNGRATTCHFEYDFQADFSTE